jgi:hypothetical protein
MIQNDLGTEKNAKRNKSGALFVLKKEVKG